MRGWLPIALLGALTPLLGEAALLPVSLLEWQQLHLNRAPFQGSGRVGLDRWQICLGALDLPLTSNSPISSLEIALRRIDLHALPYLIAQSHYQMLLVARQQWPLSARRILEMHGTIECELATRSSRATLQLYAAQLTQQGSLRLGLHAEAGHHWRSIWPIIGWQQPISSLTLDLLFPYHATLHYDLDDELSSFAALRLLRERQRAVGVPYTIWHYQTPLLALGGRYRYEEIFEAELELGRSLGPTLRTYDRRGQLTLKVGGKGSYYGSFKMRLLF